MIRFMVGLQDTLDQVLAGVPRVVVDRGVPGMPNGFFGIDIVSDDTIPEGVIEFRDPDGKAVSRLVQGPDGAWYLLDLDAVKRALEYKAPQGFGGFLGPQGEQ